MQFATGANWSFWQQNYLAIVKSTIASFGRRIPACFPVAALRLLREEVVHLSLAALALYCSRMCFSIAGAWARDIRAGPGRVPDGGHAERQLHLGPQLPAREAALVHQRPTGTALIRDP